MPLSCIPIGNPNEIQKITLSVNTHNLHNIRGSDGSEFLLSRSRIKLKHEWKNMLILPLTKYHSSLHERYYIDCIHNVVMFSYF